MRIISKSDFMVATALPHGEWHKWEKGSHYVNVWRGGTEVDVYSFAWDKNRPTMLDFTSSLQNYLEN